MYQIIYNVFITILALGILVFVNVAHEHLLLAIPSLLPSIENKFKI